MAASFPGLPASALARSEDTTRWHALGARKHWDAWPDSKVPALGNRTPRQAARTAAGRERLEALLADYAQKSVSGRNAFEPDIGTLKRKLGIG